MDSIDPKHGEIVHQYKKVQSLLKRLITESFPGTVVKYLADYAIIKSSDQSPSYKKYVLYHYTYLNNVSALRQKYVDLYGTDKPHKFALEVFQFLTQEAKSFLHSLDSAPVYPNVEVLDEYVPSPLEVVKSSISKNRRKKNKKMQMTEEELFEHVLQNNTEIAVQRDSDPNKGKAYCAMLGTTPEQIDEIIIMCIISLWTGGDYIIWDTHKRSIFVKGMIGYMAIHVKIAHIEDTSPGTINTMLFDMLKPMYDTFKHLIYKPKLNKADVENASFHNTFDMLWANRPWYVNQYERIYFSLKESMEKSPDDTCMNVYIIYDEITFGAYVDSTFLLSAGLFHAAIALSAKFTFCDGDEGTYLYIAIPKTTEELFSNVDCDIVAKEFTDELGNLSMKKSRNIVKSILNASLTTRLFIFNACDASKHDICSKCKCNAILPTRKCFICDMFQIEIKYVHEIREVKVKIGKTVKVIQTVATPVLYDLISMDKYVTQMLARDKNLENTLVESGLSYIKTHVRNVF